MKYVITRRLLCAGIALLCAVNATASPATDDLVRCFSDFSSGKDRIELARWVFSAMAAHPEIRDLSSISPQKQETVESAVGAVYTRLISQDCARETSAVIRDDGESALKVGFDSLGRLAMQEVMGSPVVAEVFVSTRKYVDGPKVRSILRGN
jgi:hypothetical protein